MNLNPTRARESLKQFNFKQLFVNELGWDNPPAPMQVSAEGQSYSLQAVAQKSGMVVYRCTAPDAHIPPYNLRRKIEQAAAKRVREHIIIYTDAAQTTQVWQWVKRQAGKPLASREHTFHRNQSGDALIQKLDELVFTLADEERGIGILDPVMKVHAGFDVEKVTKKFYQRFETEHKTFFKFLSGIPDDSLARWYVSVMLNRLMFIYFIQKKNFLNGDTNYLRNRLSESKKRKDKFYREFLCPLFFKGFAQRERTPAIRQQFGNIPYLNGGLFTEHYIEQLHGKTIAIPDTAFEKIFAFFDEYQWHLDDRPTRDDKEINPDVLGYVFEKYINQKQMGAYYTKEDITGYISQNTILPYLFDAAKSKTAKVSETFGVLKSDPDRYIYDAVKHGATQDLPKNIAAGISDVSKRTDWNKPAPVEFALPTEIWREVVARRQRYQDVRAKLANGEITSINDFITYNLNIRQFARDAIANTSDPDVLRAFWHALEKISVLDPTVGSGAFLFAALNILEDVYEACLDRMQAFVDEVGQTFEFSENSEVSKRGAFQKYSDFRAVLDRVALHPNRAYFIYKSIIVNNLYGVDIMEEAVEICKLRLFLKLVAQVDDAARIEPLPDIDFNIRAGNTLVGFATREQVKQALTFGKAGQMRMVSTEEDARMARIDELAEITDRAFQQFRAQQTEHGGSVTPEHKAQLRDRFKVLEDELNALLATQYGIRAKTSEVLETSEVYKRWLKSHEPFHWFVEFYGILNRGGFDVIIGNPPYVEYEKIREDYTVIGYESENCGNLYAYVLEQCLKLLKPSGCMSMIVPVSLIATPGYFSIRNLMVNAGTFFVSSYNIHPSCLFEGANPRLCIPILLHGQSKRLFQTFYQKWYTDERDFLFSRLSYVEIPSRLTNSLIRRSLPKIGNAKSLIVLDRILSRKKSIGEYLSPRQQKDATIYYRRTFGAFVLFYDIPPKMFDERDRPMLPTELKEIWFRREYYSLALALYFSSAFYLYTYFLSDCRNMNRPEVENFTIELDKLGSAVTDEVNSLSKTLSKDLQKNSVFMDYKYKTGRRKFQAFFPRESKPIIDQIDRVLAQHYGFTDEELDFIINYDIKYRMGKDGGEEEE